MVWKSKLQTLDKQTEYFFIFVWKIDALKCLILHALNSLQPYSNLHTKKIHQNYFYKIQYKIYKQTEYWLIQSSARPTYVV